MIKFNRMVIENRDAHAMTNLANKKLIFGLAQVNIA